MKNKNRLRIPEGIENLSAAQYQNLANPETAAAPKKNKYGNTIVDIDNIKFRSKKEANYYIGLKWQKRVNEIKDFKLQVKYILLEKSDQFKETSYYADFVVYHNDNSIEVIDTKGFRTDLYKLKKHLMFIKHNILISEK